MSVHVIEVAPQSIEVIEIAPNQIEVVQLGTLINLVGTLPDGTSEQIIVYDTNGEPQAVSMSGHATIDADGVVAVSITTTEVSDWTTAFGSAFDDALSERINDSGTLTTELFSAAEIISRLALKAATSHSHAASDITSGTLDNARVNWASPSAIGSGTAAAITGTLVIATDQLEVGNVAVRLTTLGLTRIGSSSNQYFKSQSSRMTIGANSAGIQFDISSGQQALLTATGLAVGSSTPSARLHVTETSAVTNAVIEVERVQAASTGTPSAGFGGRQLFALQNAIGTVRNAGAIDVVWTNAASGTEYASLHLKAGTANTLNTILRLGYDSANADFVELPGTTPFYMGDLGTDGTWRLMRSGNDLLIQRRESGTYVTKSTITA